MKTYIIKLFLLPALIAGLGLIPAGRVTAQTFTNLRSFADYPSDGVMPQAGLILSDNSLYGTTAYSGYSGGSSGNGTVFAVNTDGTGFTILHNFMALSSPIGITPLASALQAFHCWRDQLRSISSSDRPLVSGTRRQTTNTSATQHTA
jgi:uncharacterized repeat protein (TIGR03803 family)